MINHNAGYLRRLAAHIFDIFIFLDLVLIPLYLFSLGFRTALPVLTTLNLALYIVFVLLLGNFLNLIYRVYFLTRYGGTLGKLAFGMRVVDQNTSEFLDKKTAFYRVTAGYAFSMQFLGYGFFKVINQSENLAWHDELFNTRVVLHKRGKEALIYVALVIALFFILITLVGGEFSRSELINFLVQLSNLPTTQLTTN